MYSLGKLLWADNSVFDLGIGIGFLANITAQIGYLSISIDISKEMMNYAIRHVKATGLMQFIWKGNALDLPFR
jgi:ubiquinone/menaquinone biosynthesis C-methylase UbiE